MRSSRASSVQRGLWNHVDVVFNERDVPCPCRRRSMSCHLVLFFAYHLVAMRMLNPSSYEGQGKGIFVGFGKDQSRNQKSAVQVLSPWCWHTFLILSLFCDVVVDEKIKPWAAFQLVMSYHHTLLDISARPAYHSHCSITSNTLKRYS